MSSTRQFLSSSRLISALKPTGALRPTRRAQYLRPAPVFTINSPFHTSIKTPKQAGQTVDSETISNITQRENQLTGQSEPVQGGPTAQAQKHANEKLDGRVVSDIAKGEESITHNGAPVADGPASMAQSEAAEARNEVRRPGILTHVHLAWSQICSSANTEHRPHISRSPERTRTAGSLTARTSPILRMPR